MSYLGKKIRHFRVIDRLGKGGMGDIYVAYDERLRRKVALKAIRRQHHPNAEVKARLLREARILSRLDHPHICRIYDLLEEEETDVLVLELIEGESLKRVLEKDRLSKDRLSKNRLSKNRLAKNRLSQNRLAQDRLAQDRPARDRLAQGRLDDEQKTEIAVQIADALAAAHGQGVIHRDLKPDNVMLTPKGEVKVLDFGLSRTEADSVTLTLASPQKVEDLDDAAAWAREERYRRLKTEQGNIMGTAAYMSPEQAQGEVATAASDMYSLGLIYHELFTGESPYEPGLGLTTMLLKVAGAETFEVTGVDPDLAALIERLKSLAPAARPPAIDVVERLRWIRGRPRRRRRRRLRGLAMAFLCVIALVLGFQAMRIGIEAERANREAQRASQEAEAARQVSQFLIDLFELSDPSKARGNTVTAREILDGGAEKIAADLAGQPRIQARLRDTIGTVYGKLGLFDQAVPLLEQALESREQHLGTGHEETADSQLHLAYVLWQQGRFDDAVPLYESSLETRRRVLGPDHPDLADSLSGLGIIYWNQGRYDDAESLYQRALEIRERALGSLHPKVANSLDNLAIVYKDQQRWDDAEPLYKRSLEIREATLEADHPDLARSLNNLGVLYLDQQRYAEARPLYERALAIWEKAVGAAHPAVGIGLVNLGKVQLELGNLEASSQLYERALAIFEDALSPEHHYIGYALAGRGAILIEEGRYAEAQGPLRRALAIHEHSLGADHVEVGRRLKELARALKGQGDAEHGAQTHDRAREILAKALGPEHPEVTEEL